MGDEVTVDLDVLGRLDLLAFLKDECEMRGATVIYATHIFDGLEPWVTHVAYVANGVLAKSGTAAELVPAAAATEGAVEEASGPPLLLHTMEQWLKEAKATRPEKKPE